MNDNKIDIKRYLDLIGLEYYHDRIANYIISLVKEIKYDKDTDTLKLYNINKDVIGVINLKEVLDDYYSSEEAWKKGSGNGSAILRGSGSIASGENSVAEGYRTRAEGNYSHSEGYTSLAMSDHSHAEGFETDCEGTASHSEGYQTKASGLGSHAEGYNTIASGEHSHAEGSETEAIGDSSHAEGICTQALNNGEHACGKWNKSFTLNGKTLFSVGNGTNENHRSNVIEVDNLGRFLVQSLGGYDGKNKDATIVESLQDIVYVELLTDNQINNLLPT